MGFMRPQVQHGEWVQITHDHGSSTWTPAEYCPAILPDEVQVKLPLGEEVPTKWDVEDWVATVFPLKRRPLRKRVQVWNRKVKRMAEAIRQHGKLFKDFIESGDVEAVRLVEGWGARMSAPGYMDCTEWSMYETEEEAHHELCDQYDLCDQCGEDLDPDGKCETCDAERRGDDDH